MRLRRPFFFISLALTAVFQITAPAETFDVASIRPSGPNSVRGSDGGPGSKDPSRYIFGRATLLDLLCTAYHMDSFQVSSKTPLDRDAFDLSAAIPPGATKDDFKTMLLNLLAERFQLQLHMEIREFPAFEMRVAKTGVKFGTEAATSLSSRSEFPPMAPGTRGLSAGNSFSNGHLVVRVRGQQQEVSTLAQMLRGSSRLPIVDHTGLTGKYDFAFEFSGELPNGPTNTEPSGLPDLNTALQERLGLEIVQKKLPFDVVVVESFNRSPTGN